MADQKIRIFINGFGRIGRTILRILTTGEAYRDIEVVGFNDIEPLETCAYLFEYDSVFGPFAGTVDTQDGAMVVNGHAIPFHGAADIATLDLTGVDVVLECTGMAGSRPIVERGLRAGARAVLISGPSDEADVTVVLGANDADLAAHHVVSNASCTTNALAPLMQLLDARYGLISGHMTTVHCYTGSQPTVDKPRGNLERSRAAALSMVPTTTSAQRMIDRVLPHLAGRVEARAIRVPTASVSAIDLTIQTEQPVTAEGVNQLLRGAAGAGVIGTTLKPLVSTDLRMRPESLVVCERETSVSVGGLLRVFGWYDNEWGFSCRMLDMARKMASR
ncbi:glyceraldehyde 3-phosphate dehydrogenase NAD-binding domain-containing protein [Cognatishimia sp. SS12]|uniref:type I glyceraldehyde-3-phosphate dehydrogenase n=1 Tax=Cognatishimia sp. SS12 TaxID=2979465 RepID=UPI00233017E0|nr:glyceraldehyde 3-phosphate dehydrogenase NAD-binding domain-containing protein [Cognatishimia sp. SS12]MDC0736743.1 glyceraldehyde 3-phosphate dehydrogenase NAD-binding domain-containing protein [Cognatishimia sp. SS12]